MDDNITRTGGSVVEAEKCCVEEIVEGDKGRQGEE